MQISLGIYQSIFCGVECNVGCLGWFPRVPKGFAIDTKQLIPVAGLSDGLYSLNFVAFSIHEMSVHILCVYSLVTIAITYR